MQDPPLVWFDTHVHWTAAEFDPDRDAALIEARRAGVVGCLVPAVNLIDQLAVAQLTHESLSRFDWPHIYPAYGIHPLWASAHWAADVSRLEIALRTERPVALGEIGLDAFAGAPDLKYQQPLFEAQLALAAQYGLPVVLHARHAVESVIQAIKRVQGAGQRIPGGVVHAFNGSTVQAEQLIQLGFVLGFGGSCTYEGSRRIRALVAGLPLTAIVLETDAPDMSPAWLRGVRNGSDQLPRIAQTVASLRQISLQTLASAVLSNGLRVLNLSDKCGVAK